MTFSLVISDPLAGLEGLEGEEVRLMLAAIPPRPDYETWLRIASAVWSVLPMAEGAQLLHEWSPEEKPGEYAAKHKARLRRAGVGTLIHFAREHGFDLHAWRAERLARKWAAETAPPIASKPAAPTPFVPKGERVTFTAVSQPPPAPAARTYSPIERHAAEQLRRLYAAGFITGPDDPDTRTFAAAFVLLEAVAEISPS